MWRFIKAEPTTYLMLFKRGQVVREGSGMTLLYFVPTSLLVAVPMASTDVPFIFTEITSDFQEVTVQGQVAYRITDPVRISQLLNFSIDTRTHEHKSDDPQMLSQRVINVVNVLTRAELQHMTLKEAMKSGDAMVRSLLEGLRAAPEVTALGLEILGLSILAVGPNPETARALEADAREQLLRMADEAIYARRNAAVEQERAIRENELSTEIAVEKKKREIRESQMDAELAVQRKQREYRNEEMTAQIELEQRNRELADLRAANRRTEADAAAYSVSATMQALQNVDPKILQALASVGMKPEQFIALAFQGLAEKAEHIGQLNITPDLLREIITSGTDDIDGAPHRE